MAKCFQAQLWENSEFVSKQLTSIGNVMSKQLVNANKTTFEIIEKTNPREIEIVIKCLVFNFRVNLLFLLRFVEKNRLLVIVLLNT